jgi:hypothetical protein
MIPAMEAVSPALKILTMRERGESRSRPRSRCAAQSEDVISQRVERDVDVDRCVVKQAAGDAYDQALGPVHVLAGAIKV